MREGKSRMEGKGRGREEQDGREREEQDALRVRVGSRCCSGMHCREALVVAGAQPPEHVWLCNVVAGAPKLIVSGDALTDFRVQAVCLNQPREEDNGTCVGG